MPDWTDEQFENHHNFNRCNVCRKWTYWRQWSTCLVCKINMCTKCKTQVPMPGDIWGSKLCVPCSEVSEAYIVELQSVIKDASRRRYNIIRRWRRKVDRRIQDDSD